MLDSRKLPLRRSRSWIRLIRSGSLPCETVRATTSDLCARLHLPPRPRRARCLRQLEGGSAFWALMASAAVRAQSAARARVCVSSWGAVPTGTRCQKTLRVRSEEGLLVHRPSTRIRVRIRVASAGRFCRHELSQVHNATLTNCTGCIRLSALRQSPVARRTERRMRFFP